MRVKFSAAMTVLLSTLVLAAWTVAPSHPEGIEGTWVVTSDDESHQRGVFLFTSDGSYSMMFVRGDEPRAALGENPTDTQRLASAGEITANSGRVTIEGNEIRYEAYMANGSGYMSRWPDNDVTATYEMHDDDRMSLTMANGRVFLLRRP